MKKNNFLIVFFLVFLINSCKKEDVLLLSDIVQTDESGNVLDAGNSNDWQLLHVNDYEGFMNMTSTGVDDNGNVLFPDLNFDCQSDSIKISVFPNPVQVGQTCTLKVTSNVPFLNMNMTYGEYKDKPAAGSAGGLSPSMLSNNDKTIQVELGKDFGWPSGNVEVRLFLLTEDSCAFFTYGKIIYQ